MNRNPRYIVFWAVTNYLTESELEKLTADLIMNEAKNRRKFLDVISRHFDFERLRENPIYWQDIWIYNYIKLYPKARRQGKNLIDRYDGVIIEPRIKAYDARMSAFSQQLHSVLCVHKHLT